MKLLFQKKYREPKGWVVVRSVQELLACLYAFDVDEIIINEEVFDNDKKIVKEELEKRIREVCYTKSKLVPSVGYNKTK